MSRQEQEGRPLEFSDIVSEHHAAILADPYGFLGIPENTPFEDVRRSYITRAKVYHPDMMNLPSLEGDKELQKRFLETATLEEITGFMDTVDPKASEDDKDSAIKSFFAGMMGSTPQELDRRFLVRQELQAIAHKRMVELNVAYEAIKQKINPKERDVLVGFPKKTVKTEWGDLYEQVDLEGNGYLFFPLPSPDSELDFWQYDMRGPNLAFEWGHDPEDFMDDDERFLRSVHINNLFVHHELQQQRTEISKVLLDPFFNHFQLDKKQQELFTTLLVAGKHPEKIMQNLEIPLLRDIDHGGRLPEQWFKSAHFEVNTTEMLVLARHLPNWNEDEISMRWDNGKLILKGRTESVFTEADVILLTTLAYGPLLNQAENWEKK